MMENRRRMRLYFAAASAACGVLFVLSLAVGRFSIEWSELFSDSMSARVFFSLRLPRTCMVLLAGVGLSVTGSVYQAVFQNPLASPDIIGVSSGASAGAAAAILLFGGGTLVTALTAFFGGFAAVLAALALAAVSRRQGVLGIVLSGIAVNALAQAVLMLMKMTADPEKQLASIEFWIMGSFADVTADKFLGVFPWVLLGIAGLFLLHRQILLLSLEEEEARMLGVPVRWMRRIVLLLATLVTGAIVSITGLISFIGLIAPHIARLLTRSSRFSTTVLAGLCGGGLLLLADCLARSISASEVPVSIITSLLGAPFLFYLMCRKGDLHG